MISREICESIKHFIKCWFRLKLSVKWKSILRFLEPRNSISIAPSYKSFAIRLLKADLKILLINVGLFLNHFICPRWCTSLPCLWHIRISQWTFNIQFSNMNINSNCSVSLHVLSDAFKFFIGKISIEMTLKSDYINSTSLVGINPIVHFVRFVFHGTHHWFMIIVIIS